MKATNKLAILSLLCLPVMAEATTYYVKPDGDDNNVGTSWETALATPKAGFAKVNLQGDCNDEVLIAPGAYTTKTIACTGSNPKYRVTVRGTTDNPNDVILKAGGTYEVLRLAQNITVANLTIAGGSNLDRDDRAAGVRIGSGASSDPATDGLCIVSNCVITGCHNAYTNGAKNAGGPVYVFNNGLLVDSVVSNNTAVYQGCGVTLNGAKACALRCRIEGNVASEDGNSGAPVYGLSGGCSIIDCVVQSNVTAYVAGANGVAYAEGCTFRGNVLDSRFGEHTSTAMRIGRTAVVTNCTFIDNVSEAGYATVNVGAGDTKFIDCRFIGNRTFKNGGAIQVNIGSASAEHPVEIVGCTFDDNASSASATQGGGAIRIDSGFVNVTGSTFTDNNAKYGGAADIVGDGRATFDDCLFENNSAGVSGGGVRIATTARAFFDNCRFFGNQALAGTASVVSNSWGGGGSAGGFLVFDFELRVRG